MKLLSRWQTSVWNDCWLLCLAGYRSYIDCCVSHCQLFTSYCCLLPAFRCLPSVHIRSIQAYNIIWIQISKNALPTLTTTSILNIVVNDIKDLPDMLAKKIQNFKSCGVFFSLHTSHIMAIELKSSPPTSCILIIDHAVFMPLSIASIFSQEILSGHLPPLVMLMDPSLNEGSTRSSHVTPYLFERGSTVASDSNRLEVYVLGLGTLNQLHLWTALK